MMGPAHILAVGGNPAARNALLRALVADPAFLVEHAAGAGEAIARAQSLDRLWSAVVVDAPLPDCEVPEFCELLRRQARPIPIIVVGDTAGEQEVVRAFDAGAIDYLVKPVRPAELGARLRAHIREHETSDSARLMIGPYCFHPAARRLQDPATNLHLRLTLKEVAILTCLYRAEGKPVSRHALLREVWKYSPAPNSHTVETHLYRLRRKIEPDREHPSVILNTHGGYRLAPQAATAPRLQGPPRQPALVADD
jgi:DNA-binding response OmpR family regulator